MTAKLSRRFAFQLMFGLLACSAMPSSSYADGGDDDNSGGGDESDDDRDENNDDDNDNDDREQKEIREAARGANVTSLGKLLKHVRSNFQGEILDVRLRKKKGNYFYSIKMLSPAGRIFNVKLDAKTLAKV